MIYKLIAIGFVFMTPLFAYILVSFFRLRRLGLLFTDITFPLYSIEIAIISQDSLGYNLTPHYLIILSLLAIALIWGLIQRQESFSYRQFFKFFWRAGFFVSLIFYLVTAVLVFLTNN